MTRFERGCAVFVLCAVTAIPSSAQTFNTLANFNGANGANPFASLVQGLDGALYGTTATGGDRTYGGTVFKISFGGELRTIYSFCQGCSTGQNPQAGLALGRDGSFYGTTQFGGVGGCGTGCGTAFKITPKGVITTLAYFVSGSDGAAPFPSGLVQATDGNWYGTTAFGGDYELGSVFKITSKYALATLYSFCGDSSICSTNGRYPRAGLVEADGKLYGTTAGGTGSTGTVFSVTPEGSATPLYNFVGSDGEDPEAPLVLGTNGSLYGTTSSFGRGLNCGPIACGTIFVSTPRGILATLYNFCLQAGCPDGSNPTAALVQGTDGKFYGTTVAGGAFGHGTIFQVKPNGVFTLLHSFNSTDGAAPSGGLVQATDGNFYGTTSLGGTAGDGTVFMLSMGLGPFVKTQITSGKVGTKVTILGTNLTGATSVSFNSTAAGFTVVSNSEITTTVPSGATTGFVTVATPSGTLTSNKQFRVKP
jgi:uncharacterized repeat protein (TIGR03803 family)